MPRPGRAFSSYPLNFARVNATEDGDNKVIAGVAGKSIVLLGYTLNVTAAGVIVLKDSKTTFASLKLAEAGGALWDGGPFCPAFEVGKGLDLTINNAAGVDTLGHMTYILV